VAIRYSQVRTEARPSKPPGPRQAASRVSWMRVLGVVGGAEDPVAVDLQLVPVGVDKLPERLLVAGPGPGRQVRRHGVPLPSVGSFPPVASTDTARPAIGAVRTAPFPGARVSALPIPHPRRPFDMTRLARSV
jgi:hypothetical protein